MSLGRKGAATGNGRRIQGFRRIVREVREVALGETSKFADGVLTVGRAQAQELLADDALAEVRLSWASPGDSLRIVKILDTVEPRTKGAGGGGIFPGFLGPAEPQGRGETHILRGAAVVTAGYLPRAQEGLADMTGPAQQLSFLGNIHNLVVEFDPADDAPWEEVDLALRLGALRLAAHLAEAALDAEPDSVEDLPGIESGNGTRLPRVAAITNLQTQGTFKDVFVCGQSFSGKSPTLIDPNELDDGAIVSGQYGHPALKNPTYAHQNHPVSALLRARHDKDLLFAGLIICPEPVDQKGKERTAEQVAELCSARGFDAAIVTKEGGGNADADVSLKMDALEAAGLTTVGLFAEMAGPDGSAPPLVIAPNQATAMVSTGNYDHRVELPAMERALGGDELALLGVDARSDMTVPAAIVYCSCSPLGLGRLTCREAA